MNGLLNRIRRFSHPAWNYVSDIPRARFSNKSRPKFSWLDLQGCGLSALERLCLEEALLRHDPMKRNWAIIGTHDPTYNTRLKKMDQLVSYSSQGNTHLPSLKESNMSLTSPKYENCIIIMGLGGKVQDLLNLDLIRKDGVLVVKRFSGGGTVVVDQSCLWATFIGRTNLIPSVQPYPKDIMQWSAQSIYDRVFSNMNHNIGLRAARNSTNNKWYGNNLCVKQDGLQKSLVLDVASCGISGGNHRTLSLPNRQTHSSTTDPVNSSTASNVEIPQFALRENDYVLGNRKMGGNAQSISKDGWLHHTSFLWDYVDEHMEYLTLPSKRPDYRGDRPHNDFLVKLKQYYGRHGGLSDSAAKRKIFEEVKMSCSIEYDLEEVKLKEVMDIIDSELGGMQSFFDNRCRTKLVHV